MSGSPSRVGTDASVTTTESNAPASISPGSAPWVYPNWIPDPLAVCAAYQATLPDGLQRVTSISVGVNPIVSLPR